MTETPAPLTPLGVLVIGVLRERDMHPYEMTRLLRQRRIDRMVPVSKGTLYHTVSRLERCGLVAEVGVDRDGRRPERTIYRLTDVGADAAADWIRRELPRIERFTEQRVALASAHDLPRAEVAELLQTRRDALRARAAEIAAAFDRVVAMGLPARFLAEKSREQAFVTAEISWIDDFLVDLADPALPWGAHELDPETLARLAEHTESLLA